MVQANTCTVCITMMQVLDAGLSESADVKLVFKCVCCMLSLYSTSFHVYMKQFCGVVPQT